MPGKKLNSHALRVYLNNRWIATDCTGTLNGSMFLCSVWHFFLSSIELPSAEVCDATKLKSVI